MSAFAKSTRAALASLLAAIVFFSVPAFASSGDDSSGDVAASVEIGNANSQSAVSEETESVSDPASSEEEGISADVIGFFVRAVIPDNQINTRLTYFNLRMSPEQEQILQVEIVNETNEDILVEVQAITASTNINGIIDYRTPGIQDESMETAFSDIAEVVENPVLVPANSSAFAAVRVTMPEEEYDGVILGGLVFTKEIPEAEEETSPENAGATIQNVYSYVLGVLLQENDNPVEPYFQLIDVEAALVNYQPSYVYFIRNSEPYIVKDMDLLVEVYEGEGTEGEPIVTREKGSMDMAPNSVLEFAVSPENGELEAGTYTSLVTLVHNEQEWVFTHQFTIEAEEAQSVNDSAPGQARGETPWVTILLIVIGVLVVGFIVTLILLARKRKK